MVTSLFNKYHHGYINDQRWPLLHHQSLKVTMVTSSITYDDHSYIINRKTSLWLLCYQMSPWLHQSRRQQWLHHHSAKVIRLTLSVIKGNHGYIKVNTKCCFPWLPDSIDQCLCSIWCLHGDLPVCFVTWLLVEECDSHSSLPFLANLLAKTTKCFIKIKF